MGSIPQGKKTTQPHQFIGYWGYAQRRELEARLSLVKTPHTKYHKFSHVDSRVEDNSYPIWNVACIGFQQESIPPIHFQTDHTERIAAISASGILTDSHVIGSFLPDAWVNLQGSDGQSPAGGDAPKGSRPKGERLILGREPFGRVPLYWTQQGEVIWFASQLQLLLKIVEKPEVSIPGLYGYSCFSYVPNPLTPTTNVFAVPAGTELVWQSQPNSKTLSAPIYKRLWEWSEASEQLKDETTAVKQLQILLQQVIERQISDLKDEPVGVFLSGGLDSSVVAALLVQAGVKVIGYTLDFGDAGIPESPYAEIVAQHLKIPLVKVDASPRQIQKAIIPTVQALDLPFGDGVSVPLFLLAQRASQETKVIFNGEGGDQLFAGWVNKPLIAAGVYQTENPSGQETFIQQYLRTFHRLWGYEAQIYQPHIYEQIQNLHPEEWIAEALDPAYCKAILHRLRRAALMLKGAQNIHPRATALGFAHGLFVRSPLCDLPLAEWTFQVSGELCLQGACEKYILKRAVENWLPPEIVWRQKRGMGVPLTSWCLNEFWRQIGKWLNPGRLRVENRFSPHLAAQIAASQLGATLQDRRIGEILWLLIMWELWRVHVFGEEPGKQSFDHPFWLPQQLWRFQKKWQA